MSKRPSDADVQRIDAAFNRVLAAEAAGRERVEACRGEAERLLAAADERARRIVGRADDRILQVQRTADLSLQRALAELLDAASDVRAEEDIDGRSRDRLTAAVEALVDEMTGVDGRVPPSPAGGGAT
ncbi:MAG: hypothetical protein LJE61_00920 [Thiocapsa sp.]|nr:hypothetical protein [Thiocapsa sp.]MCG6897037.1 hypothetical protein [Thiocapsa sp.]MCG6983750.1 hypothetical protein [Thiocapsa sp.]